MADSPRQPTTIISFDVEEHWRIEAASGLTVAPEQRSYYAARVGPSTRWLLEELARHDQKATFFLVGLLAKAQPDLVRDIHRAGHELASHGWDHQRVHNFTPEQFRDDVRQCKDTLEQITGEEVLGYRAPTFSIVRQTAWALDVLAEVGYQYDSSIYPVRHDRYGIPDAPRGPFLASGGEHELLEIPPARLDVLGFRVPAGGGGYFRLFPLFVMESALRQIERKQSPPLAMLYFHPWEFDPEQDRLPLGRMSRFRTYVGMNRSRGRLVTLLQRHRFVRTKDAIQDLNVEELPRFNVAPSPVLVA
jgi:polysaccharide deacetylase family protein (PEP-CTERM system associated)